MTQIPSTQLVEVLRIFTFNHTEDLWWRENEEDRNQLDFYVNCSDFFYWGTSDLELITSEKLGILYEVKKDLDDLDIPDHDRAYGLLFAARVRGMRPQGAYYKYLHEATWPLYDDCGPKRETDTYNPKPPPTNSIPVVQTKKEEVE
jgi:hypothetical protein